MHKMSFEFFFVGHQVGLEKSVRMKHGSQKCLVGFESYVGDFGKYDLNLTFIFGQPEKYLKPRPPCTK